MPPAKTLKRLKGAPASTPASGIAGVSPATAMLLLLLPFLLSCSKPARVVNLYTWSNYIPEKVLREFEPATGIHLNYDTYDSNEALLEKIQSGVSDYDVIVPSDYMIGILRHAGLLQPLDR